MKVNCTHLFLSFLLIVMCLLAYAVQCAVGFALFRLNQPIIILYFAPAFVGPFLALMAIGIGRKWTWIGVILNVMVAIINAGAAVGIVFILRSQSTVVTAQSRIANVVLNYVIFGIVMGIASVFSLILAIDDGCWCIENSRSGGDYQKVDTNNEDDDEI
eukprot:NODE_5298_length_587_cov_63.657993_g4588_i0.p1 GENE.NODE_5298_length_587_cov_63.657993_g4588_i0~~NODE_5298_length_587_cov_63.657993_g4588_i0.p1  ORF type:complete len:174 (-),score=6.47 NODE_5298_length_587_cov_63.657993_g4588_i0:65-541(-)